MKPSKILKKAKGIIEQPEDWTQGEYYRNSDGVSINSLKEATCFCSYGAIRKARNVESDFGSPAVGYLGRAVRTLAGQSIDYFNDTHTHAEVLEAFDKAIALAEAEGN